MAKGCRAYYELDVRYVNIMEKSKDGTRNPVLQLITGLGVGGAERVVLELASSLTKQGCPVIVVAMGGDGGLLKQYSDSEFPVYLLGMSAKNPFSILRGLFSLVSLAHREKVTVIHAHMFHALLAGLLCRLVHPRVRLVFTSHSFAGFSTARQWFIKNTKTLRTVDVVFSKGQHVALNATDTRVIPNGVSVDPCEKIPQRSINERPVFLFVGRLELPKNPLALIDAFAAMQHQNCELWLVGNGTLREEVQERIANLNISARVRMLGVRKDITNLLRGADCFVMSSNWEGLPMALLEAGAAGLPVIAPPVGAIPDVLGKDCGYLTNVEDLAKALDAVVGDYGTAILRGIKLRERISNFYNLKQVTMLHLKLYQDLSAVSLPPNFGYRDS